MPLRTCFCVAATLAALVSWQPRLADGQTADITGPYAEQRKQYRESVLQYPLIKQRKLDEVFHLHLEGSALSLDPRLDPDREYVQRRAAFEGMGEQAVILCWLISQDLGQVQFELNVDDYSDASSFGRLHVLARPDNTELGKELEHVELEKTWQTPNGFRRVFFTQVNSVATLLVFANDQGPNGFVNLNIHEKDFSTLRRLHHEETERWLRPILRELHQESAFAADPAVAWQVLADQWPVDGKFRDDVAQQLKALDADDFRVRQKASNALEKLGRDGAVYLMKMDRHGLSLEQNLRIDEVISRFKPLTEAEARPLRDDPNFLLDCLYGDDAVARKLSLDRLTELLHRKIDFDLDAIDDAKVDDVNALRDKLFPDGKSSASAPPAR